MTSVGQENPGAAARNINNIVFSAGGLSENEKAAVLCSAETEAIARSFMDAITSRGNAAALCVLPALRNHGQEPEARVLEQMLSADIIYCLTPYSLAHTRARLAANRKGIRFLSLPDYGADMLGDASLSVNFREFLGQTKFLADKLTAASSIRVRSRAGTDLSLDISGRTGNCCAGFVDKHYLLGSPPDIEANIAPVETNTKGVLAVNGSVTTPRIKKLSSPVMLAIENGAITGIEAGQHRAALEQLLDAPPKRILAECGIGLNPEAALCGNMLIDEGARGCVHFGFGSNITIGGRNDAGFHLDFVCRDTDLLIDGDLIIENGEFKCF